MLTKVTMTGADETTDIRDLVAISKKYKFVEWAILVQPGTINNGKRRFPSIKWIEGLHGVHKKINLSLHLCGSFVNKILLGDPSFIYKDLAPIWSLFSRVQINTHGIEHDWHPSHMIELMLMFPEKEFIFQYDERNTSAFEYAQNNISNCSALFDLSHGAGILPKEWPDKIEGINCGYAGGLGPDNLGEEIYKIDRRTEDYSNDQDWIDMETKVRGISNYTKEDIFDLVKVEQCLKIVKPFINTI